MSIFRRRPPTPEETRAQWEAAYPPGTLFYFDEQGRPHCAPTVPMPAIDTPEGYRAWYRHGQLHRIGGPAIHDRDGYEAWYLAGVLHRADGPAVSYPDGTQMWYLSGRLHRTDGPAVVVDGAPAAWFLHGRHVSQTTHAQLTADPNPVFGPQLPDPGHYLDEDFGLSMVMDDSSL